MDVNIDYTWKEESVKTIQWENMNEKTNSETSLYILSLCLTF